MTLEITALILSGISLIVSLLVTYLTHFRAAKIEIFSGGRLLFYPAPYATVDGLVWGGFGFYLPITFHNSGTRGGTVFEVRLLIQPVFNSITYDMSWAEFAVMHSSERRFVTKNMAQPLAISGNESASEMIQFVWSPFARSFEVEEGEYDVKILVWTKRNQKPQIIFGTRTKITKEQVEDYKKCREQESALTMELLLGNVYASSDLTNQSETQKRYGV